MRSLLLTLMFFPLAAMADALLFCKPGHVTVTQVDDPGGGLFKPAPVTIGTSMIRVDHRPTLGPGEGTVTFVDVRPPFAPGDMKPHSPGGGVINADLRNENSIIWPAPADSNMMICEYADWRNAGSPSTNARSGKERPGLHRDELLALGTSCKPIFGTSRVDWRVTKPIPGKPIFRIFDEVLQLDGNDRVICAIDILGAPTHWIIPVD